MKKLIIFTIFLAIAAPVFAQYNATEKDNLYYTNVTVEKVFHCDLGYLIQYRTQRGFATIGIPTEWFTDGVSRGDIVRIGRGDWPSLSVFYKNGEVSHVRLYVHALKGHTTWGSLPQGTDVSRFFPEGDSFELQF